MIRIRTNRSAWNVWYKALAIVITAALTHAVLGNGRASLAAEPAVSQPASQPAEPPKSRKPFTSKAAGARLDSEPPDYVRTLSETGLPAVEDFDWLEFGLQHRSRWDYRDDDYRSDVLDNDSQFLLRSRGYVGIKKLIDPLRFGFEFQDARQFSSRFPETNRDVDEADILQLFTELYFEDALGKREPLRVQFGRLSMDLVDRKILGRNRFRNTTNAFDGFRVRIGEPDSDWEVNVLAVQPVERFSVHFDHGDDERWLYAVTGAWRRWDRVVVLEPYYFILDEDRKNPDQADREIHTLGLHVFGPIGTTGFDYDANTAFQFGDDGDRSHRAFATYGEVGYTAKHAWKPRLSFSTSYGSGDRDPNDTISGRFDRLFAPNHYRSTSDYWSWQNVINPKLRIEFRPTGKLRIDAAYGGYWLASDNDAWAVPGRRDATGDSGNFVGQEIEICIRYQIDPRIEIETGYSYFMPGSFVKNSGPADDSDYFYVATSFRLFK